MISFLLETHVVIILIRWVNCIEEEPLETLGISEIKQQSNKYILEYYVSIDVLAYEAVNQIDFGIIGEIERFTFVILELRIVKIRIALIREHRVNSELL